MIENNEIEAADIVTFIVSFKDQSNIVKYLDYIKNNFENTNDLYYVVNLCNILNND